MDIHRKHNKTLTPRARELRKAMTPQERHLWYDFLRSYPTRFLRQKVIDRFIADFYCASARLVIELDGAQHFTKESLSYDAERTRALNALGLTVLRFTNREIDTAFDAVCARIDAAVRTARGK